MKKYSLLIGILFFSFLFYSCSNKTTGGYFPSETECLGVELDGSQTLYAWGTGKDKKDAIEQAHKNAVRDVIFKGIRNGSKECNVKPLITEVNAQEKYERYFNQFFMDGGEYTAYISIEDVKRKSYEKQETKYQYKYGTTVRVSRAQLKEKLIQDNIINN